MLIDCDEFKTINDSYGYSVGDAVIKELADRLVKAVRPSDSVGRIGGDEFLILLPNTSLNAATTLSERLRLDISGTPFFQKEGIKASISLGVSAVPEGQGSLDQLVLLTQDALKTSKTQGRNRVSVSSDDEDSGS